MQNFSCTLCGFNKYEIIAEKIRDSDEHKVVKCGSCHHTQLFPIPKDNKEYYDHDLQEKSIRTVDVTNLKRNSKFDISRRANFIIENFDKKIEILDVGCGYGFFVNLMLTMGYDIQGVEVSDERQHIAESYTESKILNLDFNKPQKIKVDVITLFHVLEHVENPINFCKNLYNSLNEGGALIVEVPNVDDALLHTSEKYRNFLRFRAHLHYFNDLDLQKVLTKAGFKKIEVRYVQRYGLESLCGWLGDGKPELEHPKFNIHPDYKKIEDYYRKILENGEESDTIFVVAKK